MRTDTLDSPSTGLDSILLGGNPHWENFLSDKNSVNKGWILSRKNSNTKIMSFVIDSSFILEPNTGITLIPFKNVSSKTVSTWESSNIENPLVTNESSSSLEEENNMKIIADSFLFKIEELERNKRKHASIKEVHLLFEDLLSMSSIDLANQILKQSISRNFSLSIIVAFLASTLPFKAELPNRNLVFEKAKEVAISKLGQEQLNKSIFNNLK